MINCRNDDNIQNKYKSWERAFIKVLKERFDTLSDAIIAIIMTVLVLEIQIPETVNQLPQLAEAVGLFLWF